MYSTALRFIFRNRMGKYSNDRARDPIEPTIIFGLAYVYIFHLKNAIKAADHRQILPLYVTLAPMMRADSFN